MNFIGTLQKSRFWRVKVYLAELTGDAPPDLPVIQQYSLLRTVGIQPNIRFSLFQAYSTV